MLKVMRFGVPGASVAARLVFELTFAQPTAARRVPTWVVSAVLVTLHILVCFVLIGVIMLQSGNAADLAGAFGGAGSQTAFGPRGADGLPKPLWNGKTGKLDPDVLEHWKQYDLRLMLEKDWPARGPKLKGKIHIWVGEADDYFLNNAVYLVEDFLKSRKDPHYGGEVDYGDRAEHCWNGDHTRPNAISRLRYHQMHAPKIVERIRKSAPAGADVTSWRY